jgi:outer membrane protein assembly factor BamB
VPLRHAPAVDAHGRIFLHVGKRLVALEEENARPKVRWEYVTGCHAPGPTVLAPDGSLRLHTSDGCLHGLSAEGKQLWPPVEAGEPLGYAAPMVDQQGNTWICAFEGGLLRIDAQGRLQKPRPFFRSRQKLNAGGIIHRGVLYVGSEEGCLLAIQLGGEQGVNLWDHAAGQGATGWYLRSTPVLSGDGILVVAGCDEHLYGFRLDGNLVWKTQVPGQMLGSAVLDRSGQVYVGLSQSQRGQQPRGALVCIDGNSHKIRWQYEAAGPVEATPAVGDDDVIYCGDNTGLIHAVDSRGGVQWTAQVESAVRSTGVVLAPQRLAFGLDNETLVVLKCSSRRPTANVG